MEFYKISPCILHRFLKGRYFTSGVISQAIGYSCCFSQSCTFFLLKKERKRTSNLSPLTRSSPRLSIAAVVERAQTARNNLGIEIVAGCCVKEQPINLGRNFKGTGFSCLCAGRKPSACCHLMVKSVYTCSSQLAT